ncbi:tetratricopeptide repeat protein [Mariprofundus erugo]|uniref:Tetratricopeptide repeat protein n=1 Tax=Mariprofundus erugo TaxID=2528639 RepID=A0A5R9GYV9_9PROT|nr:tetratricopeptide repeat protein [Mariprofundus erugo]TLS69193.1 tetratricopeptide repeat protein [Mariprofundus erugo]
MKNFRVIAFALLAVPFSATLAQAANLEMDRMSGGSEPAVAGDTSLVAAVTAPVVMKLAMAEAAPADEAAAAADQPADSAEGESAPAEVAPSPAEATTEGNAAYDPHWLATGWSYFDQKNVDEAVRVWKSGIDALPGQQELIFGGVYVNQSAALRQLKHLGQKNSALMVYAPYRKDHAWYVVAFPDERISVMKQRLRPLLGGKVYTSKAARFQSDGNPNAAVAAPKMVARASKARTENISPSRLFMQAESAVEGKQFIEAADMLARVLAVSPDHDKARLLYGQVLVQMGEYKEASLVLVPLLKESNRDWHAWYWAATAALQLKNLDQANIFISKAVSIQGDNGLLWIEKAVVEEERNNYQQAINILNVAKDYAGELPRIYLNVGYCADKLGNKELANQSYTRFLILTANDPQYNDVREKVLSGM